LDADSNIVLETKVCFWEEIWRKLEANLGFWLGLIISLMVELSNFMRIILSSFPFEMHSYVHVLDVYENMMQAWSSQTGIQKTQLDYSTCGSDIYLGKFIYFSGCKE